MKIFGLLTGCVVLPPPEIGTIGTYQSEAWGNQMLMGPGEGIRETEAQKPPETYNLGLGAGKKTGKSSARRAKIFRRHLL